MTNEPQSEKRLEQLREQAWQKGIVADRGVDVAGAWIVSMFGAVAVPGAIAVELWQRHVFDGAFGTLITIAAVLLVIGSAFWGMLLSTYTGVLIGVTTIPAWFLHRVLLPIHFGTA